eukprot:6399554-Pyramimonas_sp.AAC.1
MGGGKEEVGRGALSLQKRGPNTTGGLGKYYGQQAVFLFRAARCSLSPQRTRIGLLARSGSLPALRGV